MDKTFSIKNPVIVVGCQRSGTTLTGQIIGAHPAALLIDENDGLYAWTDSVFKNYEPHKTHDLFLDCIVQSKTKYKGNFDSPSKRSNYVLKAPNLSYSWKEIERYWPDSKIVYLQRDIRAIVASVFRLKNSPILRNQIRYIASSDDLKSCFPRDVDMLLSGKLSGKPHLEMAIVAKIKISLSTQFMASRLSVLKVTYENLVFDPEHEISRMLKHIEFPFASECYHHDVVYHGVAPGKTVRNRSIDDQSVQMWKTELSAIEQNEIWDLVGDFLIDIGYSK